MSSFALNIATGRIAEKRTRTFGHEIYLHSMSLRHKLAVGTLTFSGSAVALVATYIVKSALGIDLTPGPSFMHDSFYIASI